MGPALIGHPPLGLMQWVSGRQERPRRGLSVCMRAPVLPQLQGPCPRRVRSFGRKTPREDIRARRNGEEGQWSSRAGGNRRKLSEDDSSGDGLEGWEVIPSRRNSAQIHLHNRQRMLLIHPDVHSAKSPGGLVYRAVTASCPWGRGSEIPLQERICYRRGSEKSPGKKRH